MILFSKGVGSIFALSPRRRREISSRDFIKPAQAG